MKAMNTIIKLLTAIATIAGIVYIVATYGEQIVAWAKKVLNSLPKCPTCEEELVEEVVEEPAAAAAEEAPAEEPAPEAEAAEEDAAPEVIVAAHEPVAEEKDFAE